MKRRSFIKSAVALSSLGIIAPSLSKVQKSETVMPNCPNGGRQFLMTQTYKLMPPAGSEGKTNLWIPVPEDTAFQKLKKVTFSGNYQQAFLTANNLYAAKTLFASWLESVESMEITVEMLIETVDWQPLLNKQLDEWQIPTTDIVFPLEVRPYLNATPHIPVDGIVKETALKIIGDEKSPLTQAHLIHEWVRTNMHRDDSVIGCGTGDVGQILKSGNLGGKCTDINSVFVALCRACGIPAREMFGIRLGATHQLEKYSKKAFITMVIGANRMKKYIFMVIALILFSTHVWAENKKVTIDIKDMNCSLCVISINKSLRSTEGVIKAKASLKTHQAEVIVPENFDNEKLLTAVSRTGYTGEINKISLLKQTN